MTTPDLELHYADDWAALYVDGKLVIVGDSYSSEEKAFSLLGVKQVYDEAFMRGQDRRSGVAQTLDEVKQFREQRSLARERAESLREQAAELMRKAADIEQGRC